MKQVAAVIGLAYGDEGKGSIVDHLALTRGAKWVVRFNGGPQAAHNVVTDDGRHHTFSQFGSGCFVGAATYLSRFMLVEPYALFNEWRVLSKTLGMTIAGYASTDLLRSVHVEEDALLITPFHWILNRAREKKRGDDRHGSCGMGIGEIRDDQENGRTVIRAGDTNNWNLVYDKLKAIRHEKILQCDKAGISATHLRCEILSSIADKFRAFSRAVTIVPSGSLGRLSGKDEVIFEGAQGVLIDEKFGFRPYTTWTDCTFGNAEILANENGFELERIGVVRSIWTRHGAGPFPSEDPAITFPDHNSTGEWQGALRWGLFDPGSFRYSLAMAKPHSVALTHCDRLKGGPIHLYRECDLPISDFGAHFTIPIAIKSYGFSSSAKHVSSMDLAER